MATAKDGDDLAAVRSVTEILQPFENKDRERILRWAREKLEMPIDQNFAVKNENPFVSTAIASVDDMSYRQGGGAIDIRSFVESKKAKSDSQFSAVVAYYYKFEAPQDDRRDSINGTDLQDACRKANWKRLSRPAQTLQNAYQTGYFDKAEYGQYRLSNVGENLVAMVLPDGSPETLTKKKTGKKRKAIKAKK